MPKGGLLTTQVRPAQHRRLPVTQPLPTVAHRVLGLAEREGVGEADDPNEGDGDGLDVGL